MVQSGEQPAYLGCFVENISSPDLTGEPPLIITRAETCFTHCSIGTFAYAAIRNRTVCTCGDTFNKYGTAPASACSTACPEEQSAFDDCGGPEANSIYSVGLITNSKQPFPTPSVHPPTVPENDTTNNRDSGGMGGKRGHSGDSAAVVISSVIVGLAALAIGIVSLMVIRKRRGNRSGSHRSHCRARNRSTDDMDDKRRTRRNGGTPALMTTTTKGHSWFMMGGGEKSHRGSRDSQDNDVDDGDGSGHHRSYTGSRGREKRDIEAQLFEGFESSAIIEDHHHSQQQQPYRQHQHYYSTDLREERLVHPHESTVVAVEQISHRQQQQQEEKKAIGSISSFRSATKTLSSSHVSTSHPHGGAMIIAGLDTTRAPQRPPSTLASKIGAKLGYLRVMTGFLDPPSPSSTSGGTMAISPISPISSTSPSSMSGYSPHPPSPSPMTGGVITAAGRGEYDTLAVARTSSSSSSSSSTTSKNDGRDPFSATQSFSFAPAPMPGLASNRQGSTTTAPSDVFASTMPSLEPYPPHSRKDLDIQVKNAVRAGSELKEPPSPISPPPYPFLPSAAAPMPSPTSAVAVVLNTALTMPVPLLSPPLSSSSSSSSPSSPSSTIITTINTVSPVPALYQTTHPRHQKQHRSNLIKDLILQGDSALEDKEMALMAQYQPHQCRQQQQQQQSVGNGLGGHGHGQSRMSLHHRRGSQSAGAIAVGKSTLPPLPPPPPTMAMAAEEDDEGELPPFVAALSRSGSASRSHYSSSNSSTGSKSATTLPTSSPSSTSSSFSAMTMAETTTTATTLETASMATASTSSKPRNMNIPTTTTTTIDTNYLAPPPRILIHKAL